MSPLMMWTEATNKQEDAGELCASALALLASVAFDPSGHQARPQSFRTRLGRVLIKSHVRSMPNSGARADIAGLPRRASSGLMQSSNPGADKLRRHACFIQPKLSAVVGQVIDRLWDPRY